MNDKTEVHWYALRITYSRELALKEYLDSKQIENFIPMHYVDVVKNEQRTRKLVPAVHNLVFVRASREQLDVLKREKECTLPMRYIMNRETRQPVVIPERQMQSFIAVAGNTEQQAIYLDMADVHLRKGDRVRVVGGIFAGIEGTFMRIKNDRRVVVILEGVMAVATVPIHPSLIEKLD
ncbi:MAG: UpxY family transcription antiterminator [Prevotellaceae bacterium]|jgi:transcription antitermination factor NusG|nr:UpxY family transcription antiterminator [Prevotellaceae bacterium]